jgi:hypothetical protein
MKYLLLLLLLSIAKIAPTQCEPNGISTNPEAPINSQAPSPLWLNNFKWYDSQGLTLIQYVLHDLFVVNNQQLMAHPFSDQNPYSYLSDDAQGNSYSIEELDMYPEDGWELVSLNLGIYPNGQVLTEMNPPQQTTFGEIPYLLLYNKQRGILRLFANSLTGLTNNTFDAVRISLKFDTPSPSSGASGLLRHYNGKDVALDQITITDEISTVVDHPNNSALWFHADFQVGYDPCTCWYQSDLRINLTFIDTQNIRMSSRGIYLDLPILDANNNQYIDNGFLAGVDYSDGWEGSGMVIYNTMDRMIDDYITRLEYVKTQNIEIAANNDQINRKLAIMKAFKNVVISGGTAILSGPLALDIINYAADLINGNNSNTVTINKDKVKAEAKKLLGQGYDWLMNQEKKGLQAELKPPPMPTATISETTFDGDISDSATVIGPQFFNPGTHPDATGSAPINALNYPVYNEILGLFAVLESPSLDVSRTVNHDVTISSTPNYFIPGNLNYQVERKTTVKVRAKLNDIIKYTFNPAAGINMQGVRIEAALGISMQTASAFNAVSACNVTYQPVFPIENNFSMVHSGDYESMSWDSDGPSGATSTLITQFMPLDLFNSWVSSLQLEYIQHWTLNESAFDLSSIETCLDLHPLGSPNFNQPISFQLKLLVTMPFNPNCEGCTANETTQLFTFDILPENINSFSQDLQIPWSWSENPNSNGSAGLQVNESFGQKTWDYSDYEQYGGFTVQGFYQPIVQVYAANNINIYGSQTKSSQLLNVNLRAQNEISVIGDVIIGPGFTLLIDDFISEQSIPSPPVSSAYINTFCSQNGVYAANASRNSNNANLRDPIQNIVNSGNMKTKIWPNPVYDQLQIETEKQVKTIIIFDSQGREVVMFNRAIDSSEGTIRLSMKDYINGVYQVCLIFEDEGRENHSIMVIH